jgi:serine/threonine protein kinase
MWAAGIITF